MRRGFADGYRFAPAIPRADESAHFHLIIERAGCIEKCPEIPSGGLSRRASHRRAADYDRRRAAMVADGNVFVVRIQRLTRAKQAARVGGVIERREKIAVIADRGRQPHHHAVHRDQERLDQRLLA